MAQQRAMKQNLLERPVQSRVSRKSWYTYRIVSKPRDIALISGVKEDRSPFFPVLVIDQVSLMECHVNTKVKVIKLK